MDQAVDVSSIQVTLQRRAAPYGLHAEVALQKAETTSMKVVQAVVQARRRQLTVKTFTPCDY